MKQSGTLKPTLLNYSASQLNKLVYFSSLFNFMKVISIVGF